MDTLVLSSGYQPVRYVSWTDAFGLWFSGRVEVIEFHTDKVIHTVSETFKVPSIIRYVKGAFRYEKSIKKAPYSRVGVHIRDEFTCQYCSKKMEKKECTIDHIVPESWGGETNWKNIVSCCAKCNQNKANKTPKQAGMKLIRDPYIPDTLELQKKSNLIKGIPNEWKNFL